MKIGSRKAFVLLCLQSYNFGAFPIPAELDDVTVFPHSTALYDAPDLTPEELSSIGYHQQVLTEPLRDLITQIEFQLSVDPSLEEVESSTGEAVTVDERRKSLREVISEAVARRRIAMRSEDKGIYELLISEDDFEHHTGRDALTLLIRAALPDSPLIRPSFLGPLVRDFAEKVRGTYPRNFWREYEDFFGNLEKAKLSRPSPARRNASSKTGRKAKERWKEERRAASRRRISDGVPVVAPDSD